MIIYVKGAGKAHFLFFGINFITNIYSKKII
jgi:hypothetical protein